MVCSLTLIILFLMAILSRCFVFRGQFEMFRFKRHARALGVPKGFSQHRNYVLEKHTLSGTVDTTKEFLVLGIESSCDDTGVAVVSSSGRILSNVVVSQYPIHQRFGGIVPKLARDGHHAAIDAAIEKALSQAGLGNLSEVDAFAATRGPGLEICLRVGFGKAQDIARRYQKPFVDVHHLEAHCLVARMPQTGTTGDSTSFRPLSPAVSYPFLCLLASGGHTCFVVCHDLGRYTFLGGTLDDSLGESLDKAARLLGLDCSKMSGGQALELAAGRARGNSSALFTSKVPMIEKWNCDFSYAGLKTAFRLAVERARRENGLATGSAAPPGSMQEAPVVESLPEEITNQLAADFQEIAFRHVEDRLKKALVVVDRLHVAAHSVVVAGGVAANADLRRRLHDVLAVRNEEAENGSTVKLVVPSPHLCTDNGVMVAWVGVEKLLLGISDAVAPQEDSNSSQHEVIARWTFGAPLDDKSVLERPKKKKTEELVLQ